MHSHTRKPSKTIHPGLTDDAAASLVDRDYAENSRLDTYDKALDIDDDISVSSMDANTRRLAELKMARRDRAEGVSRAGRSRAPAFLQSDDESDDGVVLGARRRKHYDEPLDEEDGMGDVSAAPLHASFGNPVEAHWFVPLPWSTGLASGTAR